MIYIKCSICSKYSWYHGIASRDEAMKYLDGQSPGLYLVRKRKGATGEYVLSVR